jgi:hypothetical protein
MPRITSFSFKATANPLLLLSDVMCNINEQDSSISVLVPYIMPNKTLVPEFTFDGQQVLVNDAVQISGQGNIDFSMPVEYVVQNASGASRKYMVRVYAYNGLPIVNINTNNIPIVSKDNYVEGRIAISNTLDGQDYSDTMKIKGRGNYTWGQPKKPYRIKLYNKASILGMPSDKDWVLLANYCDKALMRTAIGFELSRLTEMPWTPRTKYVDVFLNGKYEGQYLLGEHVKAGANRIPIENDGTIGEIDNWYAAEPFYATSSQGWHFTFKEPDPADATNTAYFMGMVNNFEAMLQAENYDAETGYRKYIDVSSFAKWYVISQFLASQDPNRFYYVTNSTNGVLQRSPIWDLDFSIGYTATEWGSTNTVGSDFYVQHEYYESMLQDPYFKAAVKECWNKMKQDIPLLYTFINETAQYIKISSEANFDRWDIYNSYGVTRLQKWENEVQFIKNYLRERTAWMDAMMAEW